jgi:transmembrane sensor
MTDLTELEWRRLAGYLLGESSAEEAREVERWVASAPERQALLDTARNVVRPHGVPLAVAERQIAWGRVEHALKDGSNHSAGVMRPSVPSFGGTETLRLAIQGSRRRFGRGFTGLLAVAALLLCALGYTRWRDRSTTVVSRTYTTTIGQSATFTLPDGSRVRLAPASRLDVPVGERERLPVTLTGEAYFEVISAADAPFIVHAGPVAARVLGTAFNVRHYPADSVVRIVVVSGRVAAGIRANGRPNAPTPVTLTAGMIANVTDSTVSRSTARDLEGDTGWTRGRLVFQDATVGSILTTLGRWYGYDFRLADSSLVAERITITFDAGARAESMAILEHLLGVQATIDGTTVTLDVRRDKRMTRPTRSREQYLPNTRNGR